MLQGTTDQKIRRVSIWFYVIAAFQFVFAYIAWSRGSADPALAQGAMLLSLVDIVIGLLFIVFGYFAARKEPWAFIAGLVLYVLRAAFQLVAFFNPVALVIRIYLIFRMYQGLQACLDARQARLLTRAQNRPRRLEMPHIPVAGAASAPAPTAASPAAATPAWVPARPLPQPEDQTPLR